MKKLALLILSLFLLISCNFKENVKENFKKKLDEYQKITDDLEIHFKHNPIGIVSGWGTDEGDNYLITTFYEYKLSTKSDSDLKSLSNSVIFRLIAKYPKFENKDFIEVRFTSEPKSDQLKSYKSFKVDYSGTVYELEF
tara:strand:- start:4495 stop:4911 length:417 start_codon:yes stop_codon:yes gene_type:complete